MPLVYIFADADFGGGPLDAAPCELAEGERLEVADAEACVCMYRYDAPGKQP